MTLLAFFKENPKAALGFSGGVDSSYLLYAGVQAGADIHPYYIKTVFQPQFELDDAERLCAQLGVPLTVLELDVLKNEAVTANPPDRCYHCKTALFGALSYFYLFANNLASAGSRQTAFRRLMQDLWQ